MLGLEPGGECAGLAFRVPDTEHDTVVESLNDREGPGYDRHEEVIGLADGRIITANVWIIIYSYSEGTGDADTSCHGAGEVPTQRRSIENRESRMHIINPINENLKHNQASDCAD